MSVMELNSQFDELSPKIMEILLRAGLVTDKAILETPECDLLNLGSITLADVKQIHNVVAKRSKPTDFISGDQLVNSCNRRWGRLSTGCSQLDSFLQGGVLTRGITELSGQSGCGKTQLCLQLALTVQLPTTSCGLDAGAVFICTEDRFPSIRLNQLLKTSPVAQKFPNIKFGNNIFVEHIGDTADLMRCVSMRLPQLMKQHRVGLVVVDSVAGVFRADYTTAESLQRARDLRTFASQLHLVANMYSTAVICVNQVSDIRKGEVTQTVPALGLAWANLVTCRLQMFRNNDLRHLQIVFSPHLPQQSRQYTITSAGVVGHLTTM
ncbi:DNA repair protein XRCC3 [Homalodisca vitripennis]|uniref:DNA repair protein XRCC3 n=1 Tax=Homalodisca vitripennis TaxID=197043 RepID=UPI001EEAE1F2|nr:DNA repair protein XRCC3 [Homalodisca vitripennis]XP_046673248.1 DNA repair protein XRCC3 [Homalodisca vitripennis]